MTSAQPTTTTNPSKHMSNGIEEERREIDDKEQNLKLEERLEELKKEQPYGLCFLSHVSDAKPASHEKLTP
eukprot:3453937-Rhodomonas_salina.1